MPTTFVTTTSNSTNTFVTTTGLGASVFNLSFPIGSTTNYTTTTTWVGIWDVLNSIHTFSNLTTNWEAA